jgi:hypothetical protein
LQILVGNAGRRDSALAMRDGVVRSGRRDGGRLPVFHGCAMNTLGFRDTRCLPSNYILRLGRRLGLRGDAGHRKTGRTALKKCGYVHLQGILHFRLQPNG